jgi:hypothetical protein
MIFDTSLGDWQTLLNYLGTNYLLTYTEDGSPAFLPDAEKIFQMRDEKSVALKVMLLGFTVNTHFFSQHEIEMDLLPEDVNSSDKAEAVFRLMIEIARLFNKDVFLTPEFGIATPEQLRAIAVCVADPRDRSVYSRLA